MDFSKIHQEYMNDLRNLQFYFSTPEKPVSEEEAREFFSSLTDREIDQLIGLEVI